MNTCGTIAYLGYPESIQRQDMRWVIANITPTYADHFGIVVEARFEVSRTVIFAGATLVFLAHKSRRALTSQAKEQKPARTKSVEPL